MWKAGMLGSCTHRRRWWNVHESLGLLVRAALPGLPHGGAGRLPPSRQAVLRTGARAVGRGCQKATECGLAVDVFGEAGVTSASQGPIFRPPHPRPNNERYGPLGRANAGEG